MDTAVQTAANGGWVNNSTVAIVVSLLPGLAGGLGMVEKRDKTLSYRRAEWFNADPSSISLGRCLKEALAKLKDIDERTVVRDSSQHMKLLKSKADKQGGFSLHISIETPGESASIVPTTHGTEVDIKTLAPPAEAEFMDGDAFLYVRDNNVCLCATALRDGAIAYYLSQLFRKAKIRRDADQFELMKVADINKVDLMHAQGVKEIIIRASLYKASANLSRRRNQTVGILGATARQVKAVLGKEHDVTPDSLRVALALKTDRRFKGVHLGEKRIEDLAANLLKNQEEDDEFIIVTKLGQRIGPTEIYIKSVASIKGVGKSVERDAAWRALNNFYESLDAMGALEV